MLIKEFYIAFYIYFYIANYFLLIPRGQSAHTCIFNRYIFVEVEKKDIFVYVDFKLCRITIKI